MKLLHKESLLLMPVYATIFLLVGVAFYFASQVVLHENVMSKLLQRKKFLLNNITEIEEFRQYQKYSFNTVEIMETSLPPTLKDEVKDTIIYDEIEKKYDVSSQLTFVVTKNGKNYQIKLRRAIINTSDWAISISRVVLVVFLFLLLLLFVANTVISKKIWNPFYQTLDKLIQFKISTPGTIRFPTTNITEFGQLAAVLTKMIEKIQKDYVNLKKFSENASHEFQTPLSVIQVKLEMLLQSPHLSNEELQLVNSAQKSLKKLSKLNGALLLLTKLENRQFDEVALVDLQEVIKDKIENLNELVELKSITLHVHFEKATLFKMDPVLADLLIENLLSNAIKHNIENGTINIIAHTEGIVIKNTGEPLLEEPAKLFERFRKLNQASSSVGLGLAIVKEICDTYNFRVTYRYEEGFHLVSVGGNDMTEDA